MVLRRRLRNLSVARIGGALIAVSSVSAASATSVGNGRTRPLHVPLEASESIMASPERRREQEQEEQQWWLNELRIEGKKKERVEEERTLNVFEDNGGEEDDGSNSSTNSFLGLPAAFLPDINATNIFIPSADNTNFKQTRIIGGQNTTRDRFPYAASLVDSQTGRHVCGGSLIAKDILLTAGHCSGFFDAVQIGRHNIRDGELEAALANGVVGDDPNGEDGYEFLVVEKHVVHPMYANVIRSDFAVAKLFGTVSSVEPVKLNTRADLPSNDEMATVVGYGITKKDGSIVNDMSKLLLEAEVQYMPNAECSMTRALYNNEIVSYEGYVDDNMLCAWQSNTDACQGDSGGPLVYPSSDDNPENDLQIGIVSWGLDCALEDFPGVYSRISAEMEWLTKQVCDLSNDPPEYFNCTSQLADISGVTQDVTVVLELDEKPQEIAWTLELDVSNGGKVPGDNYKPFGSYTSPYLTAVEVLSVVTEKQYSLTLFDRSADNRNTKFRLCYGNVSKEECMSAKKSTENSILICEGISRYKLITTISCPVNLQTDAPTPRPSLSVSVFLFRRCHLFAGTPDV